MRNVLSLFLCALCCGMVALPAAAQTQADRWSEERVGAWSARQPWLVGCNYIPASAINQIEMWSADTYDHDRIDLEFGWAQALGLNTARVFLSSVVYAHDPEGLKQCMADFLTLADEHEIRPIFVFFDDCWSETSAYGRQPAPKVGVHNSGWVRDPSAALRRDTAALYPRLEVYVKDILTTFRYDGRILMWDLYNEPGNSGCGTSSLPLLRHVFEWARAVAPSQPVSSGVWSADQKELNRFQLAHSDVINYHDYQSEAAHALTIDSLEHYRRPLICTEYMARTRGSRFQNILPLLKLHHVGAVNWGFVAGKTNTIYAWDAPMPDGGEPKVWFHDILRRDGSPYSVEEVQLIRALTMP